MMLDHPTISAVMFHSLVLPVWQARATQFCCESKIQTELGLHSLLSTSTVQMDLASRGEQEIQEHQPGALTTEGMQPKADLENTER